MFRSRGRNTSWYTAKSRQGSWLGRSGAKHVNEWWIIYLTMKLFKSVAPCSMYKIIENFRREKRCFLRKKVDYWKTGFINRYSNTCCLTYRFKMLEVIIYLLTEFYTVEVVRITKLKQTWNIRYYIIHAMFCLVEIWFNVILNLLCCIFMSFKLCLSIFVFENILIQNILMIFSLLLSK